MNLLIEFSVSSYLSRCRKIIIYEKMVTERFSENAGRLVEFPVDIMADARFTLPQFTPNCASSFVVLLYNKTNRLYPMGKIAHGDETTNGVNFKSMQVICRMQINFKA